MRKEVEVMRVLRLPPLGKLAVEINGQRYEQLAQIIDDYARQMALAAIGELISFAGGYQTLVDAGVASPLMPSGTPAKAPVEDDSPQAAFMAGLAAERDALQKQVMTNRLPRLGGAGAKAGQRTTAVAPSRSGELNIVEDINIVLQKYLRNKPELAGRLVRLVHNPSGGLQIEVDGKFYQKPGDLEDKTIQALLQQALKEWEQS